MEYGNTLVVLPTGLGKTLIALMLIKEKMKLGQCVMVTPTKPLAKQHLLSIQSVLGLSDDEVSLVTGEMPPSKRKTEYVKPVIISTPQTIQNDIENGNLVARFSLVIVDEAHRAVGDYAYVTVAKHAPNALIVGLTASPGGKKERIMEVLDNLHIANIEIRTHSDPDVAPYIHKQNIHWHPIALSASMAGIKYTLDSMIREHAELLSSMGFPPPLNHKGQFMQLRNRIFNMDSPLKFPAIVQYTILLHLLHMLELAETQGVHALRKYVEKLKTKDGKSVAVLLKKPNMQRLETQLETQEEHPKLEALVNLVKTMGNKKMIVFAQYRDQIQKIAQTLNEHGIRSHVFVGKKDGVTKKEQEETLQKFRNEEFQALIASSIGEEGLDIPAVDAVIFYEPVASEIRAIQRRGRAGRFREGEIHIFMTKKTRDEYYYWSANKKEKKMKELLLEIQGQMRLKHKKDTLATSSQSKMQALTSKTQRRAQDTGNGPAGADSSQRTLFDFKEKG